MGDTRSNINEDSLANDNANPSSHEFDSQEEGKVASEHEDSAQTEDSKMPASLAAPSGWVYPDE